MIMMSSLKCMAAIFCEFLETYICFLFVLQEKFSKLLSIIPEIHSMASRGEEHLYMKHCAGSAPTQTLLMEMLHAKRK